MALFRGDGGAGTGDITTVPLSIGNGGTGATNTTDARDNLGLGTIATQDASGVAITGGSVTGITDLAIVNLAVNPKMSLNPGNWVNCYSFCHFFFSLTFESAMYKCKL